MKKLIGIVVAMAAVTSLCAGVAVAATMPGDAHGLKSMASSSAQQVDWHRNHRHCWWKHGHKHCN